MKDSKKISRLLAEKEKAEKEVRRIHKLVFEGAKEDNTEMRILRDEFDKAKRRLNEIKEKLEQLRQKQEAKSRGDTIKPTVSGDAIQEKKTSVAKQNKGLQELIRLVGNTTTSVSKPKENPQNLSKPIQPSVKPIENNNLKQTKVDKQENEGEDKKTKEDIKPQSELDKKPQEDKKPEEKPPRLHERVKVDGINIRIPQKVEPKPIIPSTRLR